MLVLRYLDLVLVAIALPVFLAAGFPLAGWGAGAGVWVAQRGLQAYLDRRASASDDPRTVVGLLAGSMIARGWIVAIVVFLVGLSDRKAGLAGAVLVIVLFTAYFTMRMILRPFDTPSAPRAGGASGGAGAYPAASAGGVDTSSATRAGGASPHPVEGVR
jgi:hypothetical protein